MTYEELIATMDKNEAIFRVLMHFRSGSHFYCQNCAYWNDNAGCRQSGMSTKEANCRKVFEDWKKTEAE